MNVVIESINQSDRPHPVSKIMVILINLIIGI